MEITRIRTIVFLLAVMATVLGCELTEYDNYKKPESILRGAVVHQGDTIRVRSNAVELEIWEDGYKDYEKIPVYISQDGTFSAILFDGNYKITQLLGSGPWISNPDTIEFTMNGDLTGYEFEVEPYVKMTSSDISLNGNDEIVANFTLEEISTSQSVTDVILWMGTGRYTNSQNNMFSWNQDDETGDPANPYQVNMNGENTYSPPVSALPDELRKREYIYVRIEVAISGKEDSLYSKVHKIQLN